MIGEQVMNRSPKCLKQSDTTRRAAELMREENIGFIPICGDDGCVVGTLTDRDIVVRVVACDGSFGVPVGTVMSSDPVVCTAMDELSTIEELMADKRKSRIVCVDEQRQPIGVISLSDIAKHEEPERTGEVLHTITTREVQPT